MPSGDPTITTTAIASIWTMLSISTVFLGLRLYCRIARTQQTWWDDYLLIVGWGLLVVAVGLQTAIFDAGYLVTQLTGPMIGPANLASDSSMKLALAFTKTSFALTLLRLAKGWSRYVVYAITVIVNITCVVHAVLVWRSNCGSVDTFTFAPCWSSDSGIWMNMIGSSKDLCRNSSDWLAYTLSFSYLGCQRPRPGIHPSHDCVEPADEPAREGRRGRGHGHGFAVSATCHDSTLEAY